MIHSQSHDQSIMKHSIRKRIGSVKRLLIDDLPYANAMEKVEELRKTHRSSLSGLTPVSGEGDGQGIEVHMLCGSNAADMGMWASWSLMRFIPAGTFVLHSDGSLGETELSSWRQLIPGLVFVPKSSGNESRRERFAVMYPRLEHWRSENPYSSKVIDVHFHGKQPKMIVLDSDVLCFCRPEELLRNYADASINFSWNEDERTCYSLPRAEMEAVVGHSIPDLFNTGILVTKRFCEEDFALMEEALDRCIHAGVSTSGWFEQTLMAILAGRLGGGRPLGPHYRVVGGRTKEEAVMRHYVGVKRIRYRFFKEGIPRLLKQGS